MSNESLLPWEKVVVKKIDDDTVTLSHDKAEITVPKRIIKKKISIGDTLHITILSDEERDGEHKKLAKSILNTLFKNDGGSKKNNT